MKSLLIFFCLFVSIGSFSKGSQGFYYIEGVAYSAAEKVLKNAIITVQHNGESTEYMTDEKGHFKIKIKWTVPCKSGILTSQWDEVEKRLNQETIFISFKCQGTSLVNQWKIYSGMYENSVRGGLRKTDIHFQN